MWLCSCEGASENATPPSPAFQDLRWEPQTLETATSSPSLKTSDDEIAVGEFQLFGQCGRQVYSAAVRCSAQQIDFDLCVRVRGGEPFQLLSSYDSPAAVASGNGIPLIAGKLRLEPVSLRNEPAVDCHVDQNNRVRIASRPVTLPPKKSQTLRWGYRLSWET